MLMLNSHAENSPKKLKMYYTMYKKKQTQISCENYAGYIFCVQYQFLNYVLTT